jgi:hypothetical protein
MAALEWTPAERNGVEATGDVTNRPGPYKGEDFARFGRLPTKTAFKSL